MSLQPKPNGSSLHNIQHSAFRCRDAEQTRWFYEDVLGLPLAAALPLERSEDDGQEVKCLHVFFEMGDGNHIAFFDEPGHARPEQFDKKHGFDLHIAFETPDEMGLEYWKRRFREAGVQFSTIHHGFLHSIYCYDPNGIRIEITCKTPDYATYMVEQRSAARGLVADWTEKTREIKRERLGLESVERRSHLTPDLPPLE